MIEESIWDREGRRRVEEGIEEGVKERKREKTWT